MDSDVPAFWKLSKGKCLITQANQCKLQHRSFAAVLIAAVDQPEVELPP